MSDEITCWYVEHGNDRPIETTCKAFRVHETDAGGRIMYSNTHYLDIDDAWAALLRQSAAGVQARDWTREEARSRLERATRDLADAAHILAIVQRSHEEYMGRVKK